MGDTWRDSFFPEHREIFPHDPPPERRYEPDADMELAREQTWWEFERTCRDFAQSEPDGWAAVLRAVARAMKDQRELIPK